MDFTQLAETLQYLLGEYSNQAARQSGFIQRQVKLSGAGFVQSLVFSWLQKPEASLGELSRTLASVSQGISPQALEQRFTPQAAELLLRVVDKAINQIVAAQPVALELLQRFEAVYVVDSSTINLPKELVELYRGCGSAGSANYAGLKLHVQLDLLSGALSSFEISPASQHDAKSKVAQAQIAKGILQIRDLGYWNLAQLAQQQTNGSYYVSRLKADTRIVDNKGKRWELADFLASQSVRVQSLDLPMGVGWGKTVEGRLVAVRVQDTKVQVQRQLRLKEQARKRQRPISARQSLVSEWLVYFTNLSGEKASLEEVVVLYRLRWQIELLFKLWKQAGGLEKWRSGKPYRILCEVYAKLIGVIVSHWLSLLSGWEEGERSLVKASQVVRQYGLSMVLLLRQTSNLVDLFEVIRAVIRDTCRVNKRRKHPSAYQYCLDPSLVAS